MKHVLVASSGMSPAVVTETLYAIQRDNRPWPDELRIITTQSGYEVLKTGLPKAIASLCHEYDRPILGNDSVRIRVISDIDGSPIEDARSVKEHEALGDFILREVRDISADPNTAIHASIAGGRKTMTYYLGYAMSLFGRPQDCLSHVLVSEEFGFNPEFFYPTKQPQLINGRDGEKLDCSEAEVILADIPFVRMRQSLPSILLEKNEELHFRDLVKQIDLGDREPVERRLRLRLPIERMGLEIFDYLNDSKLIFVPMKCAEYAFYRGVVRALLEKDVRWYRPKKGEPDGDMATGVYQEMGKLHGLKFSGDEMLSELADAVADIDGPNRPNLKSVEGMTKGLSDGLFSQRVNDIKKVLDKSLPYALSKWFEIRIIYDSKGNIEPFYDAHEWPGSRRNGDYGIALSVDQIELVD